MQAVDENGGGVRCLRQNRRVCGEIAGDRRAQPGLIIIQEDVTAAQLAQLQELWRNACVARGRRIDELLVVAGWYTVNVRSPDDIALARSHPIRHATDPMTMHATIARLMSRGAVVTDGAWGTQMQARGLPTGESPDAWNLSHPDVVEQIPRAYVEAGSQIVLTNTFRGNRIALQAAGLADRVVELNREGAAISKRAAGGQAAVFGSMGPSGKMLCMGEISPEALRNAFAEQAAALAEGGADAIVVETMGDLAEAALAVEAAKPTGLPIVACMCFDSGAQCDRTMMGVTPEAAAAGLAQAGVDVIGANCGQGIQGYVAIGRRLKAACDRPVWIKANAGIPQVVDGEVVYDITPEQFAAQARAAVDAGVSFIGGCCGTSPEFIRALVREVADSQGARPKL